MRLILCVDDGWGLSFMGKRQSKDRLLRQDILALTRESLLWMTPYSARQFEEEAPQLRVAEDLFSRAGNEDYVFTEGPLPGQRPEEIVLYRWNRKYPADCHFPDAWLRGRKLLHIKEFAGSSHETITREVYGPWQ